MSPSFHTAIEHGLRSESCEVWQCLQSARQWEERSPGLLGGPLDDAALTSLGLSLSICKIRISTFNLQTVEGMKIDILLNVRRLNDIFKWKGLFIFLVLIG